MCFLYLQQEMQALQFSQVYALFISLAQESFSGSLAPWGFCCVGGFFGWCLKTKINNKQVKLPVKLKGCIVLDF